MDLSWRETAEVLGREVGLKIPHNSLFKAATAWLYRQTEHNKWPDIDVTSRVISTSVGIETTAEGWPEEAMPTADLPEVKIRKPREP